MHTLFSINYHITSIKKSCYPQLCSLSKIRKFWTCEAAEKQTYAFVRWRIDKMNSFQYIITAYSSATFSVFRILLWEYMKSPKAEYCVTLHSVTCPSWSVLHSVTWPSWSVLHSVTWTSWSVLIASLRSCLIWNTETNLQVPCWHHLLCDKVPFSWGTQNSHLFLSGVLLLPDSSEALSAWWVTRLVYFMMLSICMLLWDRLVCLTSSFLTLCVHGNATYDDVSTFQILQCAWWL